MNKKQTIITITAVLLGFQCLCLIHKPRVSLRKNTIIKSELSDPAEISKLAKASVKKNIKKISADNLRRIPLSSQLNVELLGVALGTKKDPVAFMKDMNTGKQDMYRLGKNIQGAKIINIAKGTVVVEKDGETAEISISTRGRALARRASRRTAQFAKAKNTIMLNKFSLLANARDIYASAKNVKVTPYNVSGKTVGMAVNGIKDDSFIREAGIQNKDIITCVNNQKIDSYQKALQVLKKARKQDTINVSVLRDGREQQLTYRLN